MLQRAQKALETSAYLKTWNKFRQITYYIAKTYLFNSTIQGNVHLSINGFCQRNINIIVPFLPIPFLPARVLQDYIVHSNSTQSHKKWKPECVKLFDNKPINIAVLDIEVT